MQRIATLGPSVRLVVFQFLMKSAQVPAIIPPKRNYATPSLPPVSGVEVLPSTSKLDIASLAIKVGCSGKYELVDVWQKPHETKWDTSFVRFVFCHKKHINRDELFPDFVAKRDKLEQTLANLVTENLWATQGYLNPYFEKTGAPSSDHVLMFGSAGRVPNDMVFSDGRDENNRGVGSKVRLSRLSSKLALTGNDIILVAPEPIQTPITVA